MPSPRFRLLAISAAIAAWIASAAVPAALALTGLVVVVVVVVGGERGAPAGAYEAALLR